MNQKNIFTGIAAVLILQGIAFYAMPGKLAGDSFPGLSVDGVGAAGVLFKVIAMLSILIGLLAYATRNSSGVVWAMTLGVSLLTLNTLKDKFIDHLNVPIPALLIQVLITLACIYLLTMGKKSAA